MTCVPSGCARHPRAPGLDLEAGTAGAGGAGPSQPSVSPHPVSDAAVGGDASSHLDLLVALSASALRVCAGDCVDLTALASGGVPPYRFRWDHGLGNQAGPQRVCPAQTTLYTVSVGDASIASEFNVPHPDVSASVNIVVVPANTCGGFSASDAGLLNDAAIDAGAPSGKPQPLCSFRAHASSIAGASSNHQMLVDSHGNLALVGAFAGTIDLGTPQLMASGNLDGFAVKLDRDCKVLWAKSFAAEASDGSYGQVWFNAVAHDRGDNLYLAGAFTGTLSLGGTTRSSGNGGLLIKLDPSGALVWSKLYTSSYAGAAVRDVVCDSQDRVTLVGYAGADTSLGGAPLGILYSGSTTFLAQLGADGSFGWSRNFGTAELNYLAIGPSDDNLVVMGWGTQTQTIALGSGALSLAGPGRYLAKLDALGQQLWLHALPMADDETDVTDWCQGGVAVEPGGAIVATRDDHEPTDSNGESARNDSLEKYSTDGSPVWQRRLSGAPFEGLVTTAIAIASDSHILRFDAFRGTTDLAGASLTSRGDRDVVLIELDELGQRVWARALGSELRDDVQGIALDGDRQVFVGYVSQQTDGGDLVVEKLSR
jgi:hypothetical protein